MAQTLLNVAVFGMNPQAAVEAPRFSSYSFPNSFSPHDYHPGLLKLEGRIGADVAEALEAKGHRIERWADADWHAGSVCMIEGNLEDGLMTAGADFRRPASAAGW
jgi:gamma-glutamyltranspeptidase/glutathione hydrolase